MKNWYIESAESTASAFSSNCETGLDSGQVQHALADSGKNKLRERERKGFSALFLSNLKGLTAVILIITAFVSLVAEIVNSHGKPVNFAEPLIIIAIVILNAFLSALQQTKAENYLDTLSKMNTPLSKVRRDGETRVIPSEDIVPGDIVLLSAGNLVPADGRLIKCTSLICDESILTGDRTPSQKNADAHIDVTCPLPDRVNMVYSGSIAVSGYGEFVVTATGMHTEIGSIAGILANEDEYQTPLQKQISQLGRQIGIVALIACSVVFLFGGAATKNWPDTLLTSVSLAYAAVPVGLAALTTVILVIGVQRMVKTGAVIRKLSAVETLSKASVICTDNTGVLTVDRMTLHRAWSYEDNALRNIKDLSPSDDISIVRLIQLSALCCDTAADSGNPTDAAVISALMELGQEKSELEKTYKRLMEIPFDSARKLMTAVYSTDSGIVSITKGSPEIILSRCRSADSRLASAVCDSMSKDGLRVLAVACKKLPKAPKAPSDELERNLTFIGLIGLAPCYREDIHTSIRTCRNAGIRTVMITGDDTVAVSAMARELGILTDGEEVICGSELEAMSDAELCTTVRKYSVYSRISPSDRVRIVKAWQDAGETAVITGSGVNDTTALKAADISFAMGTAGTDASTGAADIVLADDGFSSIVSAIRYGREVFRNITKAVRYLMSCSLGQTAAVFLCMLFLKASPLAAIHIMLINLIITALPALAIGMEPAGAELMQRRPNAKDEGVMTKNSGIQVCIQGLIISIVTVIAYAVGLALSDKDASAASSMAFGTLAFSQLFLAMTIRTDDSVFSGNLTSNRIMLYAQLGAAAVIVSVMLIPPLMKIFSFSFLSGRMWLWIILLTLVPILISEAVKFGERLYGKYTTQEH